VNGDEAIFAFRRPSRRASLRPLLLDLVMTDIDWPDTHMRVMRSSSAS
jgi:hypothetical protein